MATKNVNYRFWAGDSIYLRTDNNTVVRRVIGSIRFDRDGEIYYNMAEDDWNTWYEDGEVYKTPSAAFAAEYE